MPFPARVVATLLIFAATIALVVLRPRRINEAWWTCLGAAGMLVLGLVHPVDSAEVLQSAKDPLLFLLALLLLAALIERSGFFDWAAIHSARLAGGDARALFRNIFVLGAAITALLSLDTTAVILTPIVLAFVDRLGVPARPYVLACAFVANAASLPLPISNLTNLLFAESFHFTFISFAARMIVPQIAALAVTYAVLRWACREELARSFEVDRLPRADSVIENRSYFHAAVGALGIVCVSYFVAPLAGIAPYVPAFAVACALATWGVATGTVRPTKLAGQIGWSVFPFVVGLFVIVRGVENLGFARWAVTAMDGLAGRPWAAIPIVVSGATVASNLLNNLPAALLVRSVLEQLKPAPVVDLAALLGTNIGPNVITFGSLATILVLGRARERGVHVSAGEFLRFGALVTPPALVAATLALALVGNIR